MSNPTLHTLAVLLAAISAEMRAALAEHARAALRMARLEALIAESVARVIALLEAMIRDWKAGLLPELAKNPPRTRPASAPRSRRPAATRQYLRRIRRCPVSATNGAASEAARGIGPRPLAPPRPSPRLPIGHAGPRPRAASRAPPRHARVQKLPQAPARTRVLIVPIPN